MNNLYAYIKSIGCFAVFSSVIKMLAPEGSFKGYINMFLSLVFMLVLLNPLSALLKTDLPRLKDYVLKESLSLGAEIYDEEEGRSIVLEEYNELLEERLLELCSGFVEQAEVRAETDDDLSLKAVYIEGRLIGDKEELISLIDGVFACGRDKIFLKAEEE